MTKTTLDTTDLVPSERPSQHLLVKSQQWKHQKMLEISSQLTIKTPEQRQ